jgi:copper chaperone NosL
MLYLWAGCFLLLAVAGLVDFYLWAYDYGHNLDIEHAAIKVPGMSYQPPIIGSKKLLNFTAHSWPGMGGWAAFASLGTGLALCAMRWLPTRFRSAAKSAALVFALLLVSGCTPAPEPFVFGEDHDAFCRMTISDARFATQIVTHQGRAYKFDSIECMRGFLSADTIPPEDIHSIWVTDSPSRSLVRAESAIFVLSEQIQSPMGGGLMAFSSEDEAQRMLEETGGSQLAWADLTEQVGGTAMGHP